MSDSDSSKGVEHPKDKAVAAKVDKSTAAASGDPRLNVDQWRDQLFPRAPRGAPHRDAWKHAAAAALHNWIQFAHHNNGPMTLSRADYEAALQAAQSVNDQGVSTPHAPAHYGDKK